MMTLARTLKRQVRAALPAMVFLSLAVYFALNATRGDLGLVAYKRRTADLAAAQASLADAQRTRDMWLGQVAAMGSDHLDTDALDERARQLMTVSAPDDIMVPNKK